jgi:hypothetical protein
MLFDQIFAPLLTGSPVSVMARAALEYALRPEAVDEMFKKTALRQYTRELLFSTVVDLMSLVVFKKFGSLHAAYQDRKEQMTVSLTALYDKLNHVEPAVAAGLLVHSAQQLGPVIQQLQATLPPELPGYRLKIVDGNHLAATQHRLAVLRDTQAAPLPGHALVVLDPERMQVVDVVPCEDGHAQERALTQQLLALVGPGEVWMGDRNLCTAPILFGIADKQAFFVIRQHGRTPGWEALNEPRRVMRIDTGVVYEQQVVLLEDKGRVLQARRIIVELDQPTRDGDTELQILTNLPIYKVGAQKVAKLYQKRWTLERLFQELQLSLRAEIETLGYPKAALLGFCIGLVAYNILSVLKAALRAQFGRKKEQEVSTYYLAGEISRTYQGMMLAIPPEYWAGFGKLSAPEMAQTLRELSAHVRLSAFQRHPRGPKKPGRKKKYVSASEAKAHVSTARLLAEAAPMAP